METTQEISFERMPDGQLLRKIDTSAPVVLDGKEIGTDKTHSEQVITKDGEKVYSDFMKKYRKDLEEAATTFGKELESLKHLKHEELKKEHMDQFIAAIKELKSDPNGKKVKIESIDKLCNTVYRKIHTRFQLEDATKKLKAITQEMDEYGKV